MKLDILAVSSALLGFVAGETRLTGDILQGYPVIENLDITDVPANTISRYWISAAQAQGGGVSYFLPIFVARGSNDSIESGRRLSLGGSIHGDELNGVAVVQRVFRELNESGIVQGGDFNGTVIGLPTQNPSGNVNNQRQFFSSSSNGFFYDLNRFFPGESIADGGDIVGSYVSTIWNNVWGNGSNVNIAVDFHTLSTGSIGPLWAYADYRLDGVQRLAELAQPDIIKIDPGQEGTIETTWVDSDVPAITLEIGPANNWNQTLISRAVDFTFRLMDDLRMTSGGTPQVDLSNTYRATNFSDVYSSYSGWVEMYISPLEDVEEGQSVGTVYNSWGDVLERLVSAVTGRVLQVQVDPAIEQGSSVASIVYNETMS
ncbi:hypothetical protein LTR37_011560 [Vermiconidia calcicola]|uniref:Uncharacterized protein n=1 Tax=Vermiconidia calcicola TaxID=1690605 RepID=A0ACC3N232_9PEZI|nr:hypothetical protein LTR37_011560 [Vermiconidia calcicola]